MFLATPSDAVAAVPPPDPPSAITSDDEEAAVLATHDPCPVVASPLRCTALPFMNTVELPASALSPHQVASPTRTAA